MRSLGNKVVVITGASSGIGREAAYAFARRGSNLVLAARREDRLEELKAGVEALGVKALVVPTDVTVPSEVQRIIDASIEHFGQIDVLVNDAGAGLIGSFIETPMEEVRRLFDLNLIAAAEVMQAGLRVMERQGWGVIVNVASIAGLLPSPYIPVYNATKSALVMLSESVNIEYFGSRIKVVAFCPGTTVTEFGKAAKRFGRFTNWARPVRPASAEWVAERIVRCALRPKPVVGLGGIHFAASVIKLLVPPVFWWIARRYRDQIGRANKE